MVEETRLVAEIRKVGGGWEVNFLDGNFRRIDSYRVKTLIVRDNLSRDFEVEIIYRRQKTKQGGVL